MTEWTGRQESAGMARQPGTYAAVTMQPGVAVLCATGAEQITRVAS